MTLINTDTESYPVNKSKKRSAADNHSMGVKKQRKEFDVPEKTELHSPSIMANSKNAPDTVGKSETVVSSGCQPTSPSEDHWGSISFICGFCQTWKITENTGLMLHFANGKPVVGEEAAWSNVVHVHRKCIEWAPQIYYADKNVKNLDKELSRGSKLKCNKCGLKGAALGCYLKSCRRSYHVPCAVEIPECRWDSNLDKELSRGSKLKCNKCGLKGAALGCYLKSCRRSYHVPCAVEIPECRWDSENYLMLCPTHSSLKFPNEKSGKHGGAKNAMLPQVELQKTINEFWAATSTGPQNWILCGSALSTDEKFMLVKFASTCGVVTKSWNPNITHVIAATDENGACTRTLKVLMAILKGTWVLKIDWIKACMERKQPVDEEAYEVSCDNHFCYNGPKTGRLRALTNGPKLFAGMKFYFTGEFDRKYKDCLKDLTVAAGGAVVESKGQLLEQASCDENTSSDTPSSRLIVYNHDFNMDSGTGNLGFDLNQRRLELKAVAAKTRSVAILHTWLLDSIASCKLQPLAGS